MISTVLEFRFDATAVTRATVVDQMALLAEQQLQASPYLALRCIRCEFHEGTLTLRGRLPSYHLKQMAQTTVRQLDRVERVVNRIEVYELEAESTHI